MKSEIFSFRKTESQIDVHRVKISQILAFNSEAYLDNWFFIGKLFLPPVTIIIDNQIRQTLIVYDINDHQCFITVTLSEQIVRKSANKLKECQIYKFRNGKIKIQFFNKNEVFMDQNSDIHIIEIIGSKNGIKQTKAKKIEANMTPIKKNKIQELTPNLSVPLKKNFVLIRESKSEVISNVSDRTNSNQPLRNIIGTVLCKYEIGKNKSNHGKGYQVQEISSGNRFQVVVWAESEPLLPLIKGKTYEFRNFRIHQTTNYCLSYHSHFLHSSIQQMQ